MPHNRATCSPIGILLENNYIFSEICGKNSCCRSSLKFTLDIDEYDAPKLEIVIDCPLEGRYSSGCVKAVFMRK